MQEVFILWHVHDSNGAEDEKFIGVYRTEADAKAAIERLRKPRAWASSLPGVKLSLPLGLYA